MCVRTRREKTRVLSGVYIFSPEERGIKYMGIICQRRRIEVGVLGGCGESRFPAFISFPWRPVHTAIQVTN